MAQSFIIFIKANSKIYFLSYKENIQGTISNRAIFFSKLLIFKYESLKIAPFTNVFNY